MSAKLLRIVWTAGVHQIVQYVNGKIGRVVAKKQCITFPVVWCETTSLGKMTEGLQAERQGTTDEKDHV